MLGKREFEFQHALAEEHESRSILGQDVGREAGGFVGRGEVQAKIKPERKNVENAQILIADYEHTHTDEQS